MACLGLALSMPAVWLVRGTDAKAAAVFTSPYTFEQTFGTALRLLRVDLGCKITEKDLDGGYMLFEYTSPESGKKSYAGSVEIVRGKEGSLVTVQLPSLPSYHEQMVINGLVKKLSAEHGEPPKKAKPVAESADAGADGAP